MKFRNSSLLSARAIPESCVKVLISAGEASSDIHGARLLNAFREQLPLDVTLDAYGVGGPQLQAAGLRTVVDSRELMTMGFLEVILKLPKILKLLKRVVEAVRRDPPDVAILIDYPGFHFRLARSLKKLKKLNIPIVYYIPPKVWVWRKHRVQFLKKYFDKVLCIFPFEESVYRDLGFAVKYVGNPLLDELPLKLSRATARDQLGFTDTDRLLVLMPGSRESELDHHLDTMLSAAALAVPELLKAGYLRAGQKLKVLIPFPETADLAAVKLKVSRWSARGILAKELEWIVSQGNSAVCLVAADAGLIKSGTSTLEAGILNCPHVVVYRPNRTGIWIFRNIIRYKGFVGLVNLISGKIVPEILCEDVTPLNLSKNIFTLLTHSETRDQMLQGFKKLRTAIRNGDQSPSACVAEEVLEVVRRGRRECT
jgi:lipid-A-disaccharide synthase